MRFGQMPGRPVPTRRATITVEQATSGYWTADVLVSTPRLPLPIEATETNFNTAGDALDWARHMIEQAVWSA